MVEERDRRAQRLQESHRLRQRLLEIGQEILQQKDVEAILKQVAQAIREHSPFKLVAISLFTRAIDPEGEEKEEIAHLVTAGLTPEEEAKLQQVAASREFIPCREILKKGKAVGSGYYVTPELIPELVPKGVKGRVGREGARAWGPYDDLYFFLRQGEQLMGRISLGDPVHGGVPTPKELEPLELFANLATLALDRAQHLREIHRFQQRLQGIYLLSELLTRLEDLETLIQEVMEIMRENFAYDYIALFLKEGAELVLRGFHARMPPEEILFQNFQRISIHRGICGWVARHKQPALVGDVRRDSRYIPGHPDIHSELAVPVIYEEELIGVLNIESTQESAFTQEDQALLQTLARQLAIAINNLYRRQQLQEILREREWVNRFLQGLNQAKDLEEMLTLIIQRGIELLAPKANAGTFLIWNEHKRALEFRAAVNRDLNALRQTSFKTEELSQLCQQTRGPLILTRTLQLTHPELKIIGQRTDQPPPASSLAVPIREGEQVIAVLTINNLDQEGIFTEEDARKLDSLVPEIELALSRARDHERLRELAIRDALTGAYNRHYFTDFIKKEQERAKRYGHPISLVMVDMDDFYEINDRFGHAEGDRVLQEAAQLLMNNVRASDTVVRYGGDEFIVIMPQTPQKDTEEIMERLRQKFEGWNPGLPGLKLSISFGVASWTPEGRESLKQVIEKADAFMYRRRRMVRGGGRGKKR